VLRESDLVAHPLELFDEASLVGIFLLPLDEVITAMETRFSESPDSKLLPSFSPAPVAFFKG
jgi:hypothetical protein